MEHLPPPNNDAEVPLDLLAKASFDKKWDILKAAIKVLYIDEDQGLPNVIEAMRARYNFVAAESQYKYHFKKWKWKKNISTPKKAAMCKIRQTRAKAGSSTTFDYKGIVVDDKKLRRHLKESSRRDTARKLTADGEGKELRILSGSSFLLSNSIFLNWSLPYGTMQPASDRSPSVAVPSPMSTVKTPSDVVVATPSVNDPLSPNNAPSPFTRIQNRKEALDRARMFIEGRHSALVKSMSKEQRETMSKWLYQFWFYAFKTAKHWGRGPRYWNAEILRFDFHQAITPTHLPGTPGPDLNTSAYRQVQQGPLEDTGPNDVERIPKPSPLCRWSIHYAPSVSFEQWRSRTPSPEPDPNPLDEESWKPWPNSWNEPLYPERLLNGLASNDFSSIKAEELPILVPQIVKASEESTGGFQEEAFGFSIMTRNSTMLGKLIHDLSEDHETFEINIQQVRKLNPLHLATTYLDGSKACCEVLMALLFECDWPLNYRSSNVNNLGHTVFDALMIAILKAHTSVTPEAVDDALRGETRFPGEEVDICGRWDADSECIRALIISGTPCIPMAWKHKFCHTSAQAICHSMNHIVLYSRMADDKTILEIPSGLFLKRCVSCGLKMQLQPLHSLIFTALKLAEHGTKDEDLFGMLAVLVCMLSEGANPLVAADISTSAYFDGNESQGECDHAKVRPAELAAWLRKEFVSRWPHRTKIGWDIICCILRLSEREWEREELPLLISSLTRNSGCPTHNRSYFGRNMSLKILHAAVQTELLTYRRLEEGDPWVSRDFSMDGLLQSLDIEGGISIGLVEKNMMRPIRECGHLQDGKNCQTFPRAEHVMRYHFSNLEDWSRTTFIYPAWN